MNESSHNFVTGSGQPWRQQYYINNLQSDDITGWTVDKSLPGPLGNSQAVVTKNRVYLLGGRKNSNWVSTVYTAPIKEDGTLGRWTTGEPLPGSLASSQAIVIKNRVYLLGGHNDNFWVPTVYVATINEDGTLGEWVAENPLPSSLGESQAIVTKNRIYLLGGNVNCNYVSKVYTAPINSYGMLGEWTTGAPLPGALGDSHVIVTKNRVYLLGGYNDSIWVPTVYTTSINDDGTLGEWTIGTPLPSALAHGSAIVTKNKVYMFGGCNGIDYVSTVYTASINEDGTLGTWSSGWSLPNALSSSQAIVTKNRIYLLGGYDGNNYISTVYTAPIAGGLNDYSAYYD